MSLSFDQDRSTAASGVDEVSRVCLDVCQFLEMDTSFLSSSSSSSSVDGVEVVNKIHTRIKEILSSLDPQFLKSSSTLLNPNDLDESRMSLLSEINTAFNNDYKLRRGLILKRLHVTVQSFLWSKKVEGQAQAMKQLFAQRIAELSIHRDIHHFNVFCASKVCGCCGFRVLSCSVVWWYGVVCLFGSGAGKSVRWRKRK